MLRFFACCLFIFHSLFVLAQSPEDIAKKVADNFKSLSKFELTEKPIGHVQQGILLLRPERMDALDVETIVSSEEGSYLHLAASPGRLKVWRDQDLIFDGRSTTDGVPKLVSEGIFESELRYAMPAFSGDYQIRMEYYPEGETTNIFLWLADEQGNVRRDVTFRSDWDFNIDLYRFKSRTSDDELDWQFPKESPIALQFESELNDWQYATGMTLDAMWKASEYFSTLNYKGFVEQHIDFFVDNMVKVTESQKNTGAIQRPFQRYFRYSQLDDFGPQTIPFLYFYDDETKKRYVSKGLRTLLYKATRLPDGSYARTTPESYTLWAEDLYMSTILLSRAYEKNQSPKYLLEAINQTILYNRHLKDRVSRLYTHGFFSENVQQSSTKWARANALILLANVELLKVMPENHPERESILRIYRSHASSLRDYQSLDGRWHQVLNDDSTYLETSASALIVAALAEGLQNDWLFNKAEFRRSTIKGWVAITEQLDEQGNVKGISPDTSILYTDEDYNNLNPTENLPIGMAAVLYAAIAIDNLQLE